MPDAPLSYRRIVVPTDFSPAADEATRIALALAARGTVDLLHVDANPDVSQARARLEDAAARVQSAGPPTQAKLELVVDQHASRIGGILEHARKVDADLIALATHGGQLLMGGTAEQIAIEGDTDVLVVHRNTETAWPRVKGRVLVAVDLSDASRRALEVAKALTGDPARVELVHVAPPGQSDARREQVRQWLDTEEATLHVVEGEVAPTIMSVARDRDAEVLVAAVHNDDGRSLLTVGHVARRLVRSCQQPVFIVH